MKKWIVLILVLLFTVSCAFAPAIAEESYKCFSQTHPKEAKKLGIIGLGDILVIDANTRVRILAEAAHPTRNQWIQWVDFGVLDGKCDYAVSIMITSGGIPLSHGITCGVAITVIKNFCADSELEWGDVVHNAVPFLEI